MKHAQVPRVFRKKVTASPLWLSRKSRKDCASNKNPIVATDKTKRLSIVIGIKIVSSEPFVRFNTVFIAKINPYIEIYFILTKWCANGLNVPIIIFTNKLKYVIVIKVTLPFSITHRRNA